MKHVGTSIPRTDGPDKVTGRARYVDDLTFPNMWHGVTVRSSEASAKLKAISFKNTFDWSNVVTADVSDIPGTNVIYLMTEDQPALVDAEIKHAEEPVALIAAPTREMALEARKHVELVTEPSEPLYDSAESRNVKKRIYGDDNIFKHIRIEKGDAASAMKDADLVVEGTYHVGYQEQMYIEPQGVIAVPNDDGGITIYGSLQCPYYVIKALSPLLGLPKEKVRVIQCVTGGGFGGKEEYPSMISAHAAILAMKTKRPIKIIYDRSEDIAATTKRHPAVITHRTGVMKDGTLVAMDIDILLDGGAYLTLTPVVLSRAVIHAAGPYRCENLTINGDAVATNTPPNGAFRGFGAPQVAFAIERQIDKVAKALGMAPLALRRHNMLKVGDTTATGQVLKDSVGSESVLEETVALSEYEARWEEYSSGGHSTDRTRTGIGLSFFLHGAGFTGNGEGAIAGKLDVATTEDGGIEILTGSTDIGQGTRTIFPQIAADTLRIEVEHISMSDPDTQRVPDSGPTVASR
ncbi:MAG: xanthine dehydrogenase family protein, partial [Myxococcales bacterium]|nr:xanthine dehydrogenase family protein [Myxococcales bacterium]